MDKGQLARQKALRDLAKMSGQAKEIDPKKTAPIIDESFNGGPAATVPLQLADGKVEMHVGKTILDEYALVALAEYIKRGVGMVKVEGSEDVKLDTEVLARAVIGTALSCVGLRKREMWQPAGQVDEIASAKDEASTEQSAE